MCHCCCAAEGLRLLRSTESCTCLTRMASSKINSPRNLLILRYQYLSRSKLKINAHRISSLQQTLLPIPVFCPFLKLIFASILQGSKVYIVTALIFSPDSTRLAVGQSDDIIFVYKLGQVMLMKFYHLLIFKHNPLLYWHQCGALSLHIHACVHKHNLLLSTSKPLDPCTVGFVLIVEKRVMSHILLATPKAQLGYIVYINTHSEDDLVLSILSLKAVWSTYLKASFYIRLV